MVRKPASVSSWGLQPKFLRSGRVDAYTETYLAMQSLKRYLPEGWKGFTFNLPPFGKEKMMEQSVRLKKTDAPWCFWLDISLLRAHRQEVCCPLRHRTLRCHEGGLALMCHPHWSLWFTAHLAGTSKFSLKTLTLTESFSSALVPIFMPGCQPPQTLIQ